MTLSSDSTQWRVFNVLLRLLGIGATFAGSVAVVSFGFGIPAPSGTQPVTSWPTVAAGSLLAILGIAFLVIPAFRPDLGDSSFLSWPSAGPNIHRKRAWWTGEPRLMD